MTKKVKRSGIIKIKKNKIFKGIPNDVDLVLTQWSVDNAGIVHLASDMMSEMEVDYVIDGLIADLEKARADAHKWLGPDLAAAYGRK